MPMCIIGWRRRTGDAEGTGECRGGVMYKNKNKKNSTSYLEFEMFFTDNKAINM